DAVVRVLRHHEPRTLLDLGCGTGLLTRRIRRGLPGASVVGCDFSHGMLRQAGEHGHGNAWVQGDATRLPFRVGCFDTIVSTEAFHWFPDQPAAVAECFRVPRQWDWEATHGRTDSEAQAERRMQAALNALPRDVRAEGLVSVGPVVGALLALAEELHADLIVLGSHGWSTETHASVTERVIAE